MPKYPALGAPVAGAAGLPRTPPRAPGTWALCETTRNPPETADDETRLLHTHDRTQLTGQFYTLISTTKQSRVLTCSMLYPCFSLAMAMYSSTEKQDKRPVNNQGQSAARERWARGRRECVSGRRAPDTREEADGQPPDRTGGHDPAGISQTCVPQRNG